MSLQRTMTTATSLMPSRPQLMDVISIGMPLLMRST
jgi:hypothetical protein